MREIKAIIDHSLVEGVLDALEEIPGLPGVVLSEVTRCERLAGGIGCGVSQASLEIVVPNSIVPNVVHAISRAAHVEGSPDGRISVTNVVGSADIRDVESGVVW